MKKFTVWVRGKKLNNYFLTKQEAKQEALKYIIQGYTDVKIKIH